VGQLVSIPLDNRREELGDYDFGGAGPGVEHRPQGVAHLEPADQHGRPAIVFQTRQDQPSECLLRPVGPAGHQLAAVDPDAVGTVALVQHELASVGRGYQAEGVLGLHLRMIRSPGFMKNAVVESVA
jgi:hypothetical protein